MGRKCASVMHQVYIEFLRLMLGRFDAMGESTGRKGVCKTVFRSVTLKPVDRCGARFYMLR